MNCLFKKVILSVIMILPSLAMASHFSVPCSSGQMLYYSITSDSTVKVVPPSSNSWTGFSMPTGELVIPETVSHDGVVYRVESIGRDAFNYCVGLTDVVIPNSVSSIDNRAFCHCEGITSLTLSESLERIGDSSFFYCNHLQSLVIPNSVTEIGIWAFGYCDALPSVTIGSSVSLIKQNAFPTPLQSVVSLNTEAPVWSGNPFQWNSTSTPIYIPMGSLSSYQSRWTRFWNFIETDFSLLDSMDNGCSDSCTFIIVGADSYGDGWNGGQLLVMQNMTAMYTFSIEDGCWDSCAIKVCKNIPVRFVWQQGNYDYEISFEIRDEGGNRLYDTEDPTPGLFYTTTPQCSDCHIPDGITVHIQDDSVSISWQPYDNTTWDIAIGYPDSDPNSLNITQCVEPNVNYSGLSTGEWRIYIRSHCGEEYSTWTGATFFIGEYLMHASGTDTLNTCNIVVFDDGGPSGNYSDNNNSTLYIFPKDSTKSFLVTGTSYTESTYDYLRIYDGIGTNGTCIFDDYGITSTQAIGPYVSNGPITVQFLSDGGETYSGYQVNLSCVDPPCQTTLSMYSDHYIGGWGDYRGSLSVYNSWGNETGNYMIANSPSQSFTTSFRQEWDSIRLVWNAGSWDDGDRFLLKDNFGAVRYTVVTNGQSNMDINDTKGNSWNNVNNITLPMSCSDSSTTLHHITYSPVRNGSLTINGFDNAEWEYVLDSSIITITATPDANTFLQYIKVNGTSVASPYTMTVTGDVSIEVSFQVNLPELHVTDLSCSEIVAGHSFNVSWTVQNDGNIATPIGINWQDNLYLSSVPYLDYNSVQNAELIGSYENMTPLGVGESYTRTISSSLPLRHSTGTYYLFIVSNSQYAYDIEWPGDTIPTSYNPPPYIMAKSFAWERMSWDEESTIIREISEQGTWIYNELDIEPVAYKHDNFHMKVVQVSPPPTADLQVTSISCENNLVSGENVTVTVTVSNAGDTSTTSGSWNDCLYISYDSVFSSSSIQLACNTHIANLNQGLQVGDSYSATFNVTIPAEMHGRMWFFVVTDNNDSEYESLHENNNITISDTLNVTLGPWADLVVEDIGFVHNPQSQNDLMISATIRNIGFGITNTNHWNDRVYISTSPTLPNYGLNEWGEYYDYDDWRTYNFRSLSDWYYCLETINHDELLADSAAYVINRNYHLPAFIADSLQGDTFYIIIRADVDRQVFENGGDTNNEGASQMLYIPIEEVLLPDLHVTQIINSNPVAGMPMTVQWTVTNDGDGSTPTGVEWHDYIWIVSDADVRLYDYNDLRGRLLTTDNLTALASGETYTNSATVTIPADFIGNYYLFVFTDQVDAFNIDFSATGGVAPNPYQPSLNGVPYSYLSGYVHHYGVVTENPGHENDNFFYKVISIQAPATTDLAVTHISHPTDIFSGNEIEITWTVTNQGRAIASGQWSDALFLQPGGGEDLNMATAIPLGVVNHFGNVEIDSSYTQTYSVIVPAGCSGAYSVFVITDYDEDVYESIYELNNTSSSSHAINVTMTPPPDLTVSQMSFVDNGSPNGKYELSFTVTNSGLNATRTGHWKDAVYYSNNSEFDYTASLVMRIGHEGVLDRDASYTVDTVISIRSNMYGKYYVYVVTDIENNIFEYNNESNNWLKDSVMVKGLDLSVETTNISDTILSPGTHLTVSYQVKNNATGIVQNTQWRDAVYLTVGETFDETAIPLGSVRHDEQLLGDSSYVSTINVVIPSDITMGDYRIWVVADVSNSIFENGIEDNNRLCHPNQIHVLLPDLIISNIMVPDSVTTGQQFLVQWTVSNIGSGDALNTSCIDEIRYNGNVLNRQIISDETIIAGESITRSALVALGCGQFSRASVEVITDAENTVMESDEINNSLTSNEMDVSYPDLTVTEIELPNSAQSGQLATVRWIVRNVGEGSIINRIILDEVYLNTNDNSYVAGDCLARHFHAVTLGHGQDDTVTLRVKIPDGISGECFFHIVTNVGDSVCQGNDEASDEAHSFALDVQLSPYPDLQVLAVLTPEQATLGAQENLTLVIGNNGNGNLVNKQVTTNLYYSMSPTLYDPANLLSSFTQRIILPAGERDTQIVSVRIPSSLYEANYYVYAVVDVNNEIYEYNGEENNISRSSALAVVNYPLDMAAVSIQGSDNVSWGQRGHYVLTVQNASMVPTLSTSWKDEVYLSTSPLLNGGERRILIREQIEPVAPNGTYTLEFDVDFPLGQSSPVYLVASVDAGSDNPDINRSNNNVSLPITVNPIPLPDIAVNRINLLDNLVSGQPSRLSYKTTNVGDTVLANVTYTDKVYLSQDINLSDDDVEVGSTSHFINALEVQSVRIDTIDFTVPLSISGNIYVIVKTNANRDFYECNTQNNNMSQTASVTLPPPGDLIVESIDGDDSVVCGGTIHMSWKVVNDGNNSLTGRKLRSMVYLSVDNDYDSEDIQLGYSQVDEIALEPTQQIEQSYSQRLTGVEEGLYYVIIRTDVLNSFNEVDKNNNIGVSLFPIKIKLRELQFNCPTPDTLLNYQISDYKLNVGEKRNETVRISVSTPDSMLGAVNLIYAMHNGISDNLNYEFSTNGHASANAELFIPATKQGYYGISVQGVTPLGNEQNVTLLAEVLPFELLGVSPAYGGNTGHVTVELTGSRFRPDMKVWLVKNHDTIYPDTLIYVNYYKSYATFDLSNRDTGIYDVGVLNYCDGIAELPHSFRIENGESTALSTNLLFPNSPRPNRMIIISLEFGNLGNTDIVSPVVVLQSIGGCPISLTPEGLAAEATSIRIPLSLEDDAQGILRPGASGAIQVYCYTSGSLLFSIYKVR